MTLIPAVALDPAEVERAVERAYRDLVVNPTWSERLQAFIGDVLNRIFYLVTENALLGFLVLLGLGGALVAFLLWSLRRAGLVGDAELASGGASTEKVDWLAASRDAEARGDLDGAVRAGFRALIDELASRGWVPDRRSLTASEARAAVSDQRTGLATAVADASTSFEQIAYARRQPVADDVAAVRRALEEVGR